jgi:hypothetical protein
MTSLRLRTFLDFTEDLIPKTATSQDLGYNRNPIITTDLLLNGHHNDYLWIWILHQQHVIQHEVGGGTEWR